MTHDTIVRIRNARHASQIKSGSEDDASLNAAKRIYSVSSRSISLEELLKEKRQNKSIQWDQLDSMIHQVNTFYDYKGEGVKR